MHNEGEIPHGELAVVEDLDDLTHEGEHEEPPSIEKAEEQLREEMILDSKGRPYSIWCQIQQFRKYGPGVYLAFKFMKYFLQLFLVLSPLAMINVIDLVDSEEYNINLYNFQTMMESTTLSYGGVETIKEVIIISFIMVLSFSLALVYWKYLEKGYVLKCSKLCKMPSYFTVVLKKLPNYYAEDEIKAHLQRHYGPVSSIHTVKNYGQDIKHYKKIAEIADELRVEMIQLRADPRMSCLTAVHLFLEYRERHLSMQVKIVDNQSYLPTFAFISFDDALHRQKLLGFEATGWFIDKVGQPDEVPHLYKDQKLKFKACSMEPGGIIWENVNVKRTQRYLRTLLVATLLTVFMAFGIIVIFLCSAIESGLYSSQFVGMPKEDIIQINTKEALQYYCLNLSFDNFLQDVDCSTFRSQYTQYTLITIAFPFVILFLKSFLVSILKYLVNIRRFSYEIDKISWQIFIVAMLYFIKAGVIKLLLYRQFTFFGLHISLLKVFLPILNEIKLIIPIVPNEIDIFKDFTQEWVMHASRKVILIALIAFNLSIIIPFVKSFVGHYRRKAKAAKQITQARMTELLKGEELELQFIYAEYISIIMFTLLYFPIMPVIFIFSGLSLFLMYWTVKATFIRTCRKPPIYNHVLNRLGFRMILFGIILNCILTPLFFGSQRRGEEEKQHHTSTLRRYLKQPQFVILIVLLIIYYLFHHELEDFMGRVYKLIYPDAEDDKDTLTSIPVEEMHTYDMKDNPEYKEVVETIHIIDKDPLHRQSQSRGIPKFNFFNDLEQRFIEEYHEHMKKAKGCIGKCRTHKYAKLSEALKVVRIQIDQQQQELAKLHASKKELQQKVKSKLTEVLKKSQVEEQVDTERRRML